MSIFQYHICQIFITIVVYFLSFACYSVTIVKKSILKKARQKMAKLNIRTEPLHSKLTEKSKFEILAE